MNPNCREILAAHFLKNNGVIAHPTDTVYGLSCLPKNKIAINNIIKLKRRDIDKGFILLANDIIYVTAYIDNKFVFDLERSFKKTKQHPTTFLVPKNNKMKKIITGGSDFIAIRLTNNPLIKFLCERVDSAIISTSANIQGRTIAQSLLQLRKQFKGGLSFALPPINNNKIKPSAIINLVSGERIR